MHSFNDGTQILEFVRKRWVKLNILLDRDPTWWHIHAVDGDYIELRRLERKVYPTGEDMWIVTQQIYWGDFRPRDACYFNDYYEMEYVSRTVEEDPNDPLRHLLNLRYYNTFLQCFDGYGCLYNFMPAALSRSFGS